MMMMLGLLRKITKERVLNALMVLLIGTAILAFSLFMALAMERKVERQERERQEQVVFCRNEGGTIIYDVYGEYDGCRVAP